MVKRNKIVYGALVCAFLLALTGCGTKKETSGAGTSSADKTTKKLDAVAIKRSPEPNTEGPALRAVAFGNGRFVAVGKRAYVSTDGNQWTEHPIGALSSDKSWFPNGGLAYGNGLFVVTGKGKVATSSDGITWTVGADLKVIIKSLSIDPKSSFSYSRLRFLRGQFFLMDSSSRILVSKDGLKWDVQSSTYSPNLDGNGAIDMEQSGDSLFMVTQSYIYRSEDGGQSWKRVYQFEESGDPLATVHRTDSGIVVTDYVGYVLHSIDGKKWVSNRPTEDYVFDAVAVNGLYLVFTRDIDGIGTLMASRDGQAWAISEKLSGTLGGGTYGDGLWVVVGGYGRVLRSQDGHSWEESWVLPADQSR